MRKFNTLDHRPSITVTLDGRQVAVPADVSLAAGLLVGTDDLRLQPLCFMGTCFQCVAVVDGRTGQRTCRILPQEGMDVRLWAIEERGS
ncbi:MAG: (2Fe-2S)-binding protein [Bauldia sp.]|nr:MAG: (2Fe-2S)-binding protein [Bauldia sp.]MBZ0230480.1 (2Fe-2S)-binding protein [Bauldia sp.]